MSLPVEIERVSKREREREKEREGTRSKACRILKQGRRNVKRGSCKFLF
jgi:hypothetical protein